MASHVPRHGAWVALLWSRFTLTSPGSFAGRVPYTVILGFAAQAPAVPGVMPGITGLSVRDYFAPVFSAGAAVEAVTASMATNATPLGIRAYTWNAAHNDRYNTLMPTAFSE